MTRDEINNLYFRWLFDTVCRNRFSKHISYKKLLMHLHTIEFRYKLASDWNRSEDGKDLRRRYALSHDYVDSPEVITNALEGPCSVLEMLVALAIRCEESIMDDPQYGNRTGQWFWSMIANLGLSSMVDERFDKETVDHIIRIFLDRKYDPDGRGGLFTIRNSPKDLRRIEIWTQLCWYLNDFT